MPSGGGEHSQADHLTLAELDRAAADLGFLGVKWLVETRRCISLPASFDRTEPVEAISFMDRLLLEGDLVTFSRVTVGKIMDGSQGHKVDALCLTFEDVTLLPYFDTIPPNHLLHVPVLSVNSIECFEK